MSYFEIGMLLCFGAAWPFSMYKTLKLKDCRGQSLIFLLIILLGYVFGILHKIIYNFDRVIYLYAFNGLMVLTEIGLYFKYKRE